MCHYIVWPMRCSSIEMVDKKEACGSRAPIRVDMQINHEPPMQFIHSSWMDSLLDITTSITIKPFHRQI